MIGISILLVLWGATYVVWRELLGVVNEHRKNVALACSLLYLSSIPAVFCQYFLDLRVSTLVSVALLVVIRSYKKATIKKVVPTPTTKLSIHPLVWVLSTLMVGMVTWSLVQGYFWDENAAHFGVSSALSRGVAPPEHPLFPGQDFRYHYGFNVLVAQVQSWTSLGVAEAIDIVGIVCFLSLLCSAISVGHQFGGSSGAGIALLVIPLGSGTLQHLLFSDFGVLEFHWSAIPDSWYRDIPPPVISNFFQHPQGLAMAIILAVIQLFERRPFSYYRFALGSIMLGLSSLAHIVFFGLLGLGLGIVTGVEFIRRPRIARLLFELVALSTALGIAFLLGGFLGPQMASDNFITFEKDFFNEALLRRIGHHIVLFGIPFLALPIAIYRTYRQPSTMRVTALSIAIIGFTVPNFVSYERSWDIVKFMGVGAFFANLLLVDCLVHIPKRKFVVWGLVFLACSTSTLWLVRTSILDGKANIPKMHFPPPPPIAVAVAQRLHPELTPHDRVFSTNIDMSKAGLLTPGFNWRQFGRGYIMDRAKTDILLRHAQTARQHLHASDLKALGVSYLILSPADINALSPLGQVALNDPSRFEEVETVKVGTQVRRIYRVLARN